MKYSVLVAPLMASILFACAPKAPAPGGGQPNAAPGASATLENPINFPLADNATVLSTQKFSQTVNNGQRASSLMNAGAGTYSGNEVIAGAPQSFSDLQTWLHQLAASPPRGYQHQSESSGMESVHQMVRKRGVDFAVFRDSANAKRAVLVVAVDPALANRDLGPVVGLVKRYQVLPSGLRGNIDDMVKRRAGISVEQMLQPGSPVGIAMNALSDVNGKNQRAIILVDATKD